MRKHLAIQHLCYRHFVHIARNRTRNCAPYMLPSENIRAPWLRSLGARF